MLEWRNAHDLSLSRRAARAKPLEHPPERSWGLNDFSLILLAIKNDSAVEEGATLANVRRRPTRLSGEVREYSLKSEAGNEVTRVFCPSCGSPILVRNTGMPGFVTVSLGTFDDSSMFRPSVTIFARNRKPWDTMDDSIATFEAQPAWRP